MSFAFASASAPRRLANISYVPPAALEIVGAAGTRRIERLAILECSSADAELRKYFFRIAEAILLEPSSSGSEAVFEQALDAMVSLFQSLQRPGTRSTQGLWAELAMIAWSADPSTAIVAWHSASHALHDFAAGSFRLEVKSTQRNMREHAFGLEQLTVFAPGVTLVASLILEEDDEGESVIDLIELVRARIQQAPEGVRRLETIASHSLGASWRDAGETRFSLARARETLRVYRSDRVPTVPQPLPPEVKEVHFTVDLSRTPPMALEEARSLTPLFGALLPG